MICTSDSKKPFAISGSPGIAKPPVKAGPVEKTPVYAGRSRAASTSMVLSRSAGISSSRRACRKQRLLERAA